MVEGSHVGKSPMSQFAKDEHSVLARTTFQSVVLFLPVDSPVRPGDGVKMFASGSA